MVHSWYCEVYLYKKVVLISIKGVNRISTKVVSVVKILFIVSVSFSLVFPGTLGRNSSVHVNNALAPKLVSKISREVEIPPGSDYSIRFDSHNLTLIAQEIHPYSSGLSEKVIAAIVKAPQWIQRTLTRQLRNMSDPEPYADILLNVSKKYADEIAFSIACCPAGKVPPAALLKENALSLYEHDQWIHYADIVDYDNGTGNYYSTIRYRVLENGSEQQLELPPEIYYWCIVHPKITMEDVDATYGPLWRNYVFDHNDLGYPLLKEKLSTIQYVWDNTSYYQPGGRLWSTCIQEHPTAIEAISYWIGKTVPYPAIGDRPGQPCIILHEHNGWCGELQQIAVAAQRAALIPSIGVCNVGEDHVWREFFERGWHENDNWWSDTGGAVDEPDVYAYGWGKNMSAIYEWRGDDTIMDDTARYIHPQDRITVSFQVNDAYHQPIDGARVTVLVKGPKDITWYKNLFWEKIQSIWDRLPEFLKGKLLTRLFDKVKERFDAIPGQINGVTITTWNYTGLDGSCSFQLGKNREYLFLIQEGHLKKPWQLARHDTFRKLATATNTTIQVVFPDISHKVQRCLQKKMTEGACYFDVSFNTSAYQLHQNFFTNGIGSVEPKGSVECFFVDQNNFEKYKNGKTFSCYHYLESADGTFGVSALTQDWYFILKNNARVTSVVVTISMDVYVPTDMLRSQFVTPVTTLFDVPTFNVGDTAHISGISTRDEWWLQFDNDSYAIGWYTLNGEWFYDWNTSGCSVGIHTLTTDHDFPLGTCKVRLVDLLPPDITIVQPSAGAIIEPRMVNISGHCSDNVRVDHVDVAVDGQWKKANDTTWWNLSWNLSSLALGDHTISAKAVDTSGLSCLQTISFVVNESGHSWGPQIEQLYHLPAHPNNTSNMIIYANVTTTSPFALNHVLLYCMDDTNITTHEMFRYGDNPVQSRHEEDLLLNQSNAPLYGVELGQFPTGKTISYWIVARDTAFNMVQSDIASFSIQ